MKKYAFLSALSVVLTACAGNGAHYAANPQNTQSEPVPYTKEQYEKLAEAINQNKHTIINQMNKELEKLKGTTLSAPAQ